MAYGPKPKAISHRFWSKVDSSAGPESCWPWTAARLPRGYGRMGSGRRGDVVLAHRASWQINVGPIPDGMWVLHRCDNPPCVNPAHLFLGTCADNVADKVAKGRHTYGENHPCTILSEQQVREIRSSREASTALARRMGVTRATVRDARIGINWRHVPMLLALAFLWTQAAGAAPCRDVVTGAFIKCPETFVMDAGLGVVASLSSEASAGEPTAEVSVGFDIADANKSPRLDLVARFGALPGATVDLADPTTFRSMGLEGYLSQPLSPVLRLKPAALIGLEFRFSGETEPLHRAARFGYLGVRFDSKAGYLFLGAGGDERLSTSDRSTPAYLPSAAVAWRVRLANLTGKIDAYLTGRVLLYLRLGYGATEAGSDVAQLGVLIGGGKR